MVLTKFQSAKERFYLFNFYIKKIFKMKIKICVYILS